MCFGDGEAQTAEEYRAENPEYTYTRFQKVQGSTVLVAFLIEDTDDDNLFTRFDGVLDDGDTLGWDTIGNIRAELKRYGFTEAPEEEAVHA